MIAWIEWLASLPYFFQDRVWRRFVGQDDEWVDELVASVGADLGLPVVRSPIVRPYVQGTKDGRRVTVEAWTVRLRGSEIALRFRVEVSARTRVSFGPRGALSPRGQPTGDELFDEAVAVSASPGRWFGHRERLAMERVVHHGGGLSGGLVVVDTTGVEFRGPGDVLEVARYAITAAERLEAPAVTAEGVAREDRDPRARLAALRHLLGTGASAELLETLSADADPAVAAVAAGARGEAGRERLRELLTTDGAEEALKGLADHVVPGADADVDAALIRCLARPSAEGVRLAGRLGGVTVVAPLLRVGAPHKDLARSAVREIQSRLAGERGGVSVAPAGGGGALAETAPSGGDLTEG